MPLHKKPVSSPLPSANLTPWMTSGDGLGYRPGGAAPLEYRRDIDQSYKIEGGVDVFGFVRFSALNGQKCFT